MREAGEVEDFLLANFVAHAGVPAVVRFHQANDATASVPAEGLFDVVLVVGEEVRAFGRVGLGLHGDVVVPPEAGFQGGVDFWDVEVAAEVEEGGFGGWGEAVGGDVWFWESSSTHWDLKEARETTGDEVDGLEGEGVPGAEVADIPPEVGLFAIAAVKFQFRTKVDSRVGACEVFGQAQGWIVVAVVLKLLWDGWWSSLGKRDWWWNECGCSRLM